MKRKLVIKTKYGFVYEREEAQGYTSVIEIRDKNTYTGYKGIEVTSYQKDVNKDGFNNAVGLRKDDLLRLPLMILHFKMYGLFHGGEQG